MRESHSLKSHKVELFARDFSMAQLTINEISTDRLSQASSFPEMEEELIRIESAFMKALSMLSPGIFKELGQKFGLEADWVVERPKEETIDKYYPHQQKLSAVLERPRPSWRSAHELADYLFRIGSCTKIFSRTRRTHESSLDFSLALR